ncbi:TIGR03085 family metal-binding protein [Gordonia sp. (in: high G+C Gram-positive bacteria)]|uniref:TIGR03085 family metal-binding protein n=1 Tax=Gordonia sp. (in: high G+C Gram-positive bacteria) TaxID=84139 RepID=UPI0016B89C4C|nr:TIGR03085 family metal-binding protein [Gordonia sp. (in: high G+C Gram-positive bacteria)]NLG46757.1 TIGR03085 family protein [Gordonia sp. (in: high G+C Gram-positive bacteria)]
MNLARSERAALVATMRETGPDAPTLCDGWNNRDLAIHLILRERRLDATAGIFVGALAGHTASVTASYAERPWDELLVQLAEGPPWYSPFRAGDRFLNLAEMFVHHEDVLRGGADPNGPITPRTISPELQRGLETPLRTVGRRIMASSPVRARLVAPGGRELMSVGHGESVTVSAEVGELLLFAFGRAPVDVEFSGTAVAVASLRSARRSL